MFKWQNKLNFGLRLGNCLMNLANLLLTKLKFTN